MACNYLEFDISSIDLADATGNSNVPPYVDGIVYGEYNDCSGNTVTQQYSSAGIFSATTCFDSTTFLQECQLRRILLWRTLYKMMQHIESPGKGR
jgi:hypothetical protein